MPTMTLLPDGASGHTYHWANSGGSSHEVSLSDDNGDTSYVACSANARQLTLTYANPSIAEANIASITSVQFTSSGRSTARTSASLVDISFNAPTAGFSETESYNPHAVIYETITGTARTTYDGIHDWSYSRLEDLQMLCTKNGTVDVYLSYLALIVTYTPAVTDSATFFGANF